MSQQPNYFRIGLFVVGAVLLIVVGVLAISADTMGGEPILMETYFNESVQGLKEGSALTHRGVNIGRVETITFVAAQYPMEIGSADLDQFGRYVMVVVGVDRKKVPGLTDDIKEFKAMMANQVKLGLRFKITYQGITGLAMVETDYVDPHAIDPVHITWEPKNTYIPSTPSMLSSFTQAVESVFKRLEHIDFEAMMTQMEGALGSVDQAIRDAKVDELRDAVLHLMDEIGQTNQKLQSLAGNEVATAVQQFNATLSRVDQLIGRHEGDVDRLLVDLRGITGNIRLLSETLKDDPGTLLLSSPPARSESVK
ncbi:MlaD family protein [Planctomycetota bacterium]